MIISHSLHLFCKSSAGRPSFWQIRTLKSIYPLHPHRQWRSRAPDGGCSYGFTFTLSYRLEGCLCIVHQTHGAWQSAPIWHTTDETTWHEEVLDRFPPVMHRTCLLRWLCAACWIGDTCVVLCYNFLPTASLLPTAWLTDGSLGRELQRLSCKHRLLPYMPPKRIRWRSLRISQPHSPPVPQCSGMQYHITSSSPWWKNLDMALAPTTSTGLYFPQGL